MKEGGRSGEHSGAVVKKKSSSGCLIIKKKGGENGTGMGGFSGGPSSRHFFDSGKEKKRSRMVLSDSGSSDEFLEPVRRKVVPGGDKFRNGSAAYEKSFVGNREIGRDRSRSGLDVFEFDEYERFDEKIRKDFYDDRLKLYRHRGDPRESGTGSSRIMVDKRTHSYLDNTSNVLNAKSKGKYGSKNRFESEDDEAHLPISLLREKYREASDEPIRLQGKNGVLKVMVNKKKKMGLPHRSYDHVDAQDRKESRSEDVFKKKLGLPQKSNDHLEAEDRKGSRSEAAIKKKAVMRPSFHSEKLPEKPIASMRMDKNELKLRKSLSTKSSKETEDGDIALKLGSPTMQACSSAKAVKNEGNRTSPSENVTPGKGKDSKVKRGSGTEKQLLREKIRNMLLAAGWTIDYRPRRNRDYLDAVYINPSGTAYWSIIKAYEALQKQSEEEETAVKPVGEFTPLPDEILSKLTRQTRKKMEREMKKKRRDEGSSRNAKKARVKESAKGTDSDQQEEKLSSYMKQNRKSLKARLNEADHGSGDDSSDNDKATPKQDRVAKSSSRTMIQGRKSRKIGRTLVVRSSDKGPNSENDGFVPYTGKRTLLSWLIECGTVNMSEKVQYMNRRKTRAMLEGWITTDGIHCGCCSKILTVSKFELHAGSKLRLPFPNIFLQSGQSLMQCQIDAWNKQEDSDRKGFHTVNIDGDDPNDDTCGLCGDGGDLICCDGCPSTFHQSCLNIKMLPKGDWHCPNCACKFCRIAGGSSPEASGIAESALLTCRLCEKKYHKLCSEGVENMPADTGDATSSFCGHECQELYSQLLKLLGVKHELESGFSWSLVCRSDPSSDTLPLEFSQKVECNSKLAVALSVMDECFLPIVDRRSGINLIHNVVYNCGSNFSRLNYSGFYTAILERGDEIISAASIRIHGIQLAEMPFIGTRHIYRRQGMCRRLLSAIESALSSFKVEKLVIPAIAEHMHTWTDVFGFNPIEESLKQEMRSMNMLVFPGTDMLQKPIVKYEIPKGNIAAPSGEKCVEVERNNLLAKKSELDSPNVNEINGIDADTESSSQATPSVPSDDSSLDTACEPVSQPSSKEPVPINSPTVKKVEDSCSDLKCLSPSDTSPAIPETGKPVLGSPVRDDVQVPALENRCKLDSFLELDLNTCDNTEEQDGNNISDKVADVDSGSLNAPCELEPQYSHKESVSVDTESDKKVAESAIDMECDSAGDACAVALEPPVKEENIQPDSNVAESASDLQCTLISPDSVDRPVKKEYIQLDGKEAESTPGSQCTLTSAVALEPSVEKENIHSDSMVAESSPDLQRSLASPVALEPPVKKENSQSDSKVAEASPDVQCISVGDASPVVLETPKPLAKENIDSPTEDCTGDVSVSDASPVVLGTPKPLARENIDSPTEDCTGDVSVSDASPVVLGTPKPLARENIESPTADCTGDVSVSDASPVVLETPKPLVKENIESLTADCTGDVSVSDASPVVLETPKPLVKENIESPTGDCTGDVSVSDASPVVLETPKPLVKENIDSPTADCTGDVSVSDANPVVLETPKPLVKENIESPTADCTGDVSVSDASPVVLETPKPLVKENIESPTADCTGDVSVSDANPVVLETPKPLVKENIESPTADCTGDVSVSDANPVVLETPKPLVKENIESLTADCTGDVSVSDASPVVLETPKPLVKENIESPTADCTGDVSVSDASPVVLETPKPLVKENIESPTEDCTGDVSVSDARPVILETSKPLVKENIESPTEDCTDDEDEANSKASCLKLENVPLGVQNPAEENGNDESTVKFSSDLNLPGPDETESKTEEASEVDSKAETEHKDNTCTPALLL